MSSQDSIPHTKEINNDILSLKFVTRKELVEAVRAIYARKGYILATESSKTKYVYLKCDRGGSYRNSHGILPEERQRETASRLIDCPFRISGKKNNDGLWMVKLKNDSHNHEPSTDLSGHPFYRRLGEEDMKKIEHMTHSGIQPRQILSSMRQDNPTLPAVSRTIYNAKAKIRRDNLAGRTKIQALFEELGQNGFEYNFERDTDGHLTRVFFSHPRSIILTQKFSSTFVMDCTYKTNKYKMPLLDIIGIIAFNTSFYSCFVFLERENEENYVWALEMFKKVLGQANQPSVIVTDRERALVNAIKVVFPGTTNLLCVWHIEKNVAANCKKYFETKEGWDSFLICWNKVVYSQTVDIYEVNWRDLTIAFVEKQNVVEYLRKNWLPWRKMFVDAWTEDCLHLGNRATSRAEGAHAKLKKYLQVSTGNLKEVKTKLCSAVENEFKEIETRLESERNRVSHHCNIPFFRNGIFHVSRFALNKMYKQYKKAKNNALHPICTGQFIATMGLPCAHQMRNWKNLPISLDKVHSNWRIDNKELSIPNTETNGDNGIDELLNNFREKYQEWPLGKKALAEERISEMVNQSDVLFEPIMRSHKVHPKESNKRKAVSSTRMDPSQFEIVESTLQFSSNNNGISTDKEIPTFIDMNYTPDSSFFL